MLSMQQRKIVARGLILAVLVGLFPPWRFAQGGTQNSPSTSTALGHAPIFLAQDDQMAEVDVARLAVYWIVILFGTAAGVIVKSPPSLERKQDQVPPA